MRLCWIVLVLCSCGEDEEPVGSCGLSWSFTQPVVPSCDDIDGRVREVAVASWAEALDSVPHDALFVSQQHCDDHADGSIDAPFCWIDHALAAGAALDHASVYLNPGEYSIMGEVACGAASRDPLNIDILGAGAQTTRLHATCDLVAGTWSMSDITLAAESVLVPAGSKLILERVLEENLGGDGFLDVLGELVVSDLVIDLDSPVGSEADPDIVAETLVVYDISGSSWEQDVAVRLCAGAVGMGHGGQPVRAPGRRRDYPPTAL